MITQLTDGTIYVQGLEIILEGSKNCVQGLSYYSCAVRLFLSRKWSTFTLIPTADSLSAIIQDCGAGNWMGNSPLA
jgi:hypothetical protein